MDALKKAEQEKKEAAKRLKEAQEKTGEDYQLEAKKTDEIETPAEQPELTQKPEPKLKPGPVTDDSDAGFDFPMSSEDEESVEIDDTEDTDESEIVDQTAAHLEPTAAEPVELSLTPGDDTVEHAAVSDEDDHDREIAEEVKPNLQDRTFALNAMSLSDDASPPFEDTVKNVTNEKLVATRSDTTLSKSFISAETLVQDMGSGREIPTPVAAQTVFSAVSRYSERRQFMEWIVFLSLVCAIVVAIGIFYYFKVTPLTPETSSPLVAKGIEAGTDKTIAITLPEVEPAGEVSGDMPAPVATADTNMKEEQATAISHPPADMSLETETPISEEKPVAEQSAMDTMIPPAEKPVPVTTPETPAQKDVTAVLPRSLPEEITVEESAIAISRNKSVRKEDSLVQSAYAAYQAGNYTGAESQYAQALQSDPENRDALLGMAALAHRKGNIQSAYEQYLNVLRYFPRDTTARAAIINLQSAADPNKSESLLKILIQEDPDSAYLYFTLGNLFARQQRWPEAQREFFNAYRLDPGNPDYALNLAVSLDHLGQNRAAIDYYKKALELASVHESRFESSPVITRISMLEAIENGL